MTDKELYTPRWIKWYGDLYTDGTKGFDAEQIGWYQLLLQTAMKSASPELGFLEDDDEGLREIAKVKDLVSLVTRLLYQNDNINSEDRDKIRLYTERRWAKVLAKFQKSIEHPGYIYNKRLTNELKSAYRATELRSKAGKVGMAKRWHQQDLVTSDITDDINSDITAPYRNDNAVYNKNIVEEDKETTTKNYRDKTSVSKKLDGPTWIDPDFKLTEEQHAKIVKLATGLLSELNWSLSSVESKLQQCQTEFIEYWSELKRIDKECNTVKGKKSNWYMTFRKCVESMCSFELRKRASGKNGQTKLFESSSERNARLERENAKLFTDEDPNNIQDSSQGNDRVNPTRLSLAVDGD